MHPICHRTIHATVSNADLARLADAGAALAEHPELRTFLVWIAQKPPDFSAPTRRRRTR